MQASSLEALAAINPQLSADIVSTGIQSTVLQTIDLQERPVFRLRMTDIAAYTKYPFCLLTPQHKVEEQMRQYIGNKIHWKKRLVDLKEDGCKYELQFESGEVLTARYIVAADGSKSRLRSFANIRFLNPYTNTESSPGSSSDLSFVVADVLLSSPLPANIPRDTLQMMVGGGGVVLTAPMLDTTSRSSNLFRLYLGVPDTPPRNPDAAYLQTILDARGPGSHLKTHSVPQIARVLHSSRFRTRPALADRYVQRAKGGGAYIILVGDAAHKHGPAGGQGMNMGICDGVSAAQAIDEHRTAALGEGKGRDAVEIMDGYSTRRRAVAREVIDMVEGMTELEKGGAGWIPYLRVTALWMMFKMPFVNSMLAWKLSGLGHAKKP